MIKALGKGRIRILSHVGSEIVACHLENVLYVPEIRLNLVSLGSAMGKGFEFYSNCDGCALKKNNVTFVVGVSFRNLFKLSINVDFPKEICASVAITDMFRLWHSRLDHQNQEYVKDILRLFNKSVPCNKDFSAKIVNLENKLGCLLAKGHVKQQKSVQCKSIRLGVRDILLLLKTIFRNTKLLILFDKKVKYLKNLKIFVCV